MPRLTAELGARGASLPSPFSIPNGVIFCVLYISQELGLGPQQSLARVPLAYVAALCASEWGKLSFPIVKSSYQASPISYR
jgi:hypothetical protein